MTELLKKALEHASMWSAERQNDAARLLLLIEEQDHATYRLSPEQEAGVRDALAEVERGNLASEEEMEALWAKCGL
jgi:hypothetical protein